ncbi:MAG: FAD-binding protein [Chitinophagaceae bacterium]|nr:FAD-binding protein [Chitinophagaceae bacterium]
MQQTITIKLKPAEADNATVINRHIGSTIAVAKNRISGFHVIKRSLDARSRQPWIILTVLVFVDEPFYSPVIQQLTLLDVSASKEHVVIVGAGPAGLFAALKLIENGIKPIILERGQDVRTRRRDLARINKEGIINPESNYCFGEGGAGTYSDGKLYTRSSKRGDVARILNVLVQFGAEERIRADAHPHIGTNKLPQIITAIRERIIACGGQVLFGQKVNDLIVQDGKIKAVRTAAGLELATDQLILATGHSARDIFELLDSKNILIESKPFALGVRVEHPQELIDQIQYHCPVRDPYLPPASYNLVHQIGGKGVFSFCMCPGGIIAPAATAANEIVVNGWSPSKRNNPFANSGIVVSIEEKDYQDHHQSPALAALAFQHEVEKRAFDHGGGKLVAPAQRLVDFSQRKLSADLPDCSYLPGINSAPLDQVLPPFVYSALANAFIEFGKKMKGYFTNDALVVATESRTSSPIRIPRDNETLEHPQVKGLYPCSEGAGYAGGIVSAAMDGENVVSAILKRKNY